MSQINDIVKKMEKLVTEIPTMEGEKLVRAKAEHAELAEAVKRIQDLATAEQVAKADSQMADREFITTYHKLVRGEEVGDVARKAFSPVAGTKAAAYFNPRTDFILPGGLAPKLVRGDIASNVSYPGSLTTDGSPRGMIEYPSVVPATAGRLPLPNAPIWEKATKYACVAGIAYKYIPQGISTELAMFAGTSVSGASTAAMENQTIYEGEALDTARMQITTNMYNSGKAISRAALNRAPEYEGMTVEFLVANTRYQIDKACYGALVAQNALSACQIVTRNTYGIGTGSATAAGKWTDIVNVEEALPYFWQNDAEYLLSQSVRANLKATMGQVAGSTVGPLFSPNTSETIYGQLNGHPYFLDWNVADAGTACDVIYGNFKWVTAAQEGDVVVRRTDQGEFMTKNQVYFCVTAFVGVDVPMPWAFAVLN